MPCRNEPSSFVSEIAETSTLPLIWSASRSNLFLKELMLRCAKTILFKFLVRISLSILKLTSSVLTSENLEIHLPSFILEQFESVLLFQKLNLKNFFKIFAKIYLFYLNATFSDPSVLLLSYRCQWNIYLFACNNFLNMSLSVKRFSRYFYGLSGL